MTKSVLALEFKQYKFNAGAYYFINKETRELIVIVYVDNVCFMDSKYFLLPLELK